MSIGMDEIGFSRMFLARDEEGMVDGHQQTYEASRQVKCRNSA